MSLIERLRKDANRHVMQLTPGILTNAANLLESQAARIAELEEKLKTQHIQHKRWQMACADAQVELADLRRKINEAPVVSHKWQDTSTGGQTSGRYVSLISKEDLA